MRLDTYYIKFVRLPVECVGGISTLQIVSFSNLLSVFIL